MADVLKLKRVLPLKARIQIFQSTVQSHLNYCTLIWGFLAEFNIELLFRNQKRVMRAVMPRYVNYFYKEGKISTHTKESFLLYLIELNMYVYNVYVWGGGAMFFFLFSKNRSRPKQQI